LFSASFGFLILDAGALALRELDARQPFRFNDAFSSEEAPPQGHHVSSHPQQYCFVHVMAHVSAGLCILTKCLAKAWKSRHSRNKFSPF
jgi:hypothetical protein